MKGTILEIYSYPRLKRCLKIIIRSFETASYVLKTKGKVIPVTFDKTNLCAEYENGIILKGESHIDENHKETSRIKNAFLEPRASANPYALQRIEESNLIIIGPGDLYTSIIPILLVDGMRERIQASHAKIVYVMNLMTKSGQTSGYTAMDHIKDLEYYLGKNPTTSSSIMARFRKI